MPFPFHPLRLIAVILLTAAALAGAARAETADRSQPMTVEADKPGTVDLHKQQVLFNGNVLITQGTMRIRAEHVELREAADGYRSAIATGGDGRQASFSQKRDGVDETVEGVADRIEYDARTDTLRLVGHASVKRLRDGVVADEVNGALITWDNTTELFSVAGGVATPNNPAGRVRAVFAPPPSKAASAAPQTPASAPALKSAPGLGAPR